MGCVLTFILTEPSRCCLDEHVVVYKHLYRLQGYVNLYIFNIKWFMQWLCNYYNKMQYYNNYSVKLKSATVVYRQKLTGPFRRALNQTVSLWSTVFKVRNVECVGNSHGRGKGEVIFLQHK